MHNNSDIPDNWIICRSTKQVPSRKYYFNTVTGESVWEHPCVDRKPNIDVNKDLMNCNLPQPEAEALPAFVKKEICSPEATSPTNELTNFTQKENIASETDTSNSYNIRNTNTFDLRQFLNEKRGLNMDEESTIPQQTTKNIAQRRMLMLREGLKSNSNFMAHWKSSTITAITPPKGDLDQNFNKPNIIKTRIAVSRNLNNAFRDPFINNPSTKIIEPKPNMPTLKKFGVNGIDFAFTNQPSKPTLVEFGNYCDAVTLRNTEIPKLTEVQSSSKDYLINSDAQHKTRKRKIVTFNESTKSDIGRKITVRRSFTGNNFSNNSVHDAILSNNNRASELRQSTSQPSNVGLSIPNRQTNNEFRNIENLHKTKIISNAPKFSVNDRLQRNVISMLSNKEIPIKSVISEEPLSRVKLNIARRNEACSNEKVVTSTATVSLSKASNKYIKNNRTENIFKNQNTEAPVVKITNLTSVMHPSSSEIPKCTGIANTRLKTFRDSMQESNKGIYNQGIATEDIVMEQDEDNNETIQYGGFSEEDMEWETISEEKVLQSVNDARKELLGTSFIPEVSVTCTNQIQNNNDSKPHIVIDTNIFLSHLPFIQHFLLDDKYENFGHPIIIVPWMVLQELDYIKDRQRKPDGNSKLASLARKAISYLNSSFRENSPNLYGQTAMESSRELFQVESSDDKILNCCLQTKEKAQNVLLLSNDQNLRTKAIVSHIPAYSKDEISAALRKLVATEKKVLHSEQSNNMALPVTSQQFRKLTSVPKRNGLNKRSAIAKAPNATITKISDTNEQYFKFDKCLKDILHIYKQYCGKIMQICSKINNGVEIDNQDAVISKTLPKMKSILLKFMEAIKQVTLEPHYYVQLQDLRDFTQLIMEFLVDHGIDCINIDIKDMGSFCKNEREKILAFDTRLRSVYKILNAQPL